MRAGDLRERDGHVRVASECGDRVQDLAFIRAGVGLPVDLTIHDPSAVSWGDGFISINSATIISSVSDPNVPSRGTAEIISDVIPLTEEITLEAWIQPANNVANDGPARVVTMSVNPTNRNFTLGQDQTFWQARLRTIVTGNNGTNPLLETDPPLALQLQHVVYTRAMSGDAKIYIDAIEEGSISIGGNLSNWDSNYDLALGNEPCSCKKVCDNWDQSGLISGNHGCFWLLLRLFADFTFGEVCRHH